MIDTHCHLNLGKYFPKPAEAIQRALDAGIERLIVVGIDLETSRVAVELSEQFACVFATVGYHPTSCGGYSESWLVEIETLLQCEKVVAYGEIGLDYHWDTVDRIDQFNALRSQWLFARAKGLPVVFHSREAYPDLLDFLEGQPHHPSLFHCFAGNKTEAARAVALDCYFGVDGPLTYKKAEDLRTIVKTLPRDRVLIETDSPFLTPVPYRGKPNEPAYVDYVNGQLAELWNVSDLEADRITTENAERFFTKLKRTWV